MRSRRLQRTVFAFAAALGLCWSPMASSFVPQGSRIAKATAEANRAASRTQALQLAVSLRVADRDAIATGSLVTHPSGLARLELRGANRVERHLLVGTRHTASRGGEQLDQPREFLPPLFLLQVDSAVALRQALSDYGMDLESVALAPCQSRACYVIGDASRVARAPSPGDDAAATAVAAAAPATVWIDTEKFQVVRIELERGVVVEFGAFVAWGSVLFPESITILEPGQEVVHFDVEAVVPVNAPAAEFGRGWLLAPAELPTAAPPDAR